MQVRNSKVYKERRECRASDFKKLYRFSLVNLRWISEHFLGSETETRGGALSPEQKMKIFVRYLADPGFQVGVGEDTGVHQSSVSRTVDFVSRKIVEKVDLWIKFPRNQREIEESQQVWQRSKAFPLAIGALDCTHIKISKPKIHGDEYVNRKGVPSINVQATCDGAERFTSVDIRWPGSVHDSRIWRNSATYRVMRATENAVLLADEGYGLAPWLMVPYQDPTTEEQREFNRLHKSERAVIERCFGQLKKRFPMMQYTVRVGVEKLTRFILSAFILHNVAKYLNDPDDFDEPHDSTSSTNADDPEGDSYDEEPSRVVLARGKQKRREIAAIIQTLNVS